jgi:hypothetical protein
VAANLERQILVPESVLCRDSVTRHISGILVREQGVTGNDGDRGESVGSEEGSARGGVDVRVVRVQILYFKSSSLEARHADATSNTSKSKAT